MLGMDFQTSRNSGALEFDKQIEPQGLVLLMMWAHCIL
jgi:hypothetical protein